MNTTALLRHFADLRDGTHGDVVSRRDKEGLFGAAVALLDPQARRALAELDADLLLGTGEYTATGVRRAPDGGLEAIWALSWPEQRAAGVPPITLRAVYGAGFHHPHLRGGTVGEWPLNVFTPGQAAEELPTLRVIAAADLHNLVFLRDFRIVPATSRPATSRPVTSRPADAERVLGGAGRAESAARDESAAHGEGSAHVESTAHGQSIAREESAAYGESGAREESAAHGESAAHVKSTALGKSATHATHATHAAHAVRVENGA